MPAVCIVGVQWGDEGKGKVIDFFAQEADLVVRWAGGNNAGHTICLPDGREFVLHLLPGGVFKPSVVNVLGAGMVVDPWQFLEELDALAAAGVEIREGAILLSHRTHLVLPWHRALDHARDGETSQENVVIGTTGRGIGPCYEDKACRKGLRLADLARPAELGSKLRSLARERNALLEKVYDAEPIDPVAVEQQLLAIRERLLSMGADTGHLVRQALKDKQQILFEGAQGVLLDLDQGTYPFVTSSNAGSGGVPAGVGVPPRAVEKVVGISKAYCTRVGEGPFPSELHGEEGEILRKAGREFGATTGRPRRCGWYDAVAGRYTAEVSGVDELVLTKLDVLSGIKPLKIVVGYGGQQGFPAAADDLSSLSLETLEMESWDEPLTGAKTFSDLPAAAQAYVKKIEELVGVPAAMISIGPGRNEVLRR